MEAIFVASTIATKSQTVIGYRANRFMKMQLTIALKSAPGATCSLVAVRIRVWECMRLHGTGHDIMHISLHSLYWSVFKCERYQISSCEYFRIKAKHRQMVLNIQATAYQPVRKTAHLQELSGFSLLRLPSLEMWTFHLFRYTYNLLFNCMKSPERRNIRSTNCKRI